MLQITFQQIQKKCRQIFAVTPWNLQNNLLKSAKQLFLNVKLQYLRGESHVPYRLNHVQAHLDATMGVIASGDRQAGDAVVTIAEELYPQTMVLRRELIEASEEIIQHLD